MGVHDCPWVQSLAVQQGAADVKTELVHCLIGLEPSIIYKQWVESAQAEPAQQEVLQTDPSSVNRQ